MTPESPDDFVKMLAGLMPSAVYPSVPTWVICVASNQTQGNPMIANICANPGKPCNKDCKTWVVCHPDDFDQVQRNVQKAIREFGGT